MNGSCRTGLIACGFVVACSAQGCFSEVEPTENVSVVEQGLLQGFRTRDGRMLEYRGEIREFGTHEEWVAEREAHKQAAMDRKLRGEAPPARTRREWAQAFRSVSRVGNHEYFDPQPNWRVADAILRPRQDETLPPAGTREPGEVPPEELQGMRIFDADNRVLTRANTTYPFSAQMNVRHPNQGNLVCSATLIGPSTAVSAAHCFHTGSAWFNGAGAFLGAGADQQDSNQYPFGQEFCYVVHVPAAWTAGYLDEVFDIAVIDFETVCNRAPGNAAGWLGVWAGPDSYVDSGNQWFYVYGYPGVSCPGGNCFLPSIWGHGSNWSGKAGPYELKYRTDITGGQSGAGVYLIIGSNRYVIGANRGEAFDLFQGGWYNNGRQITPDVLDWFETYTTWSRSGSSWSYPSN